MSSITRSGRHARRHPDQFAVRAGRLSAVEDDQTGCVPGPAWYELEWLDADGTRLGGAVGGRADTDAGWCSGGSADWVQAAPFRAHVRHLIVGHGLAWRTVALLAGVPAAAMTALLHGRNGRPQQRIHPVLAGRLFRLTGRDILAAGMRPMPADLCRAALRDLRAAGWTMTDFSARTGLQRDQLAAVADGRCTHCSRLAGATLLAAAQALRHRPPPARLGSGAAEQSDQLFAA